MSPIQRSYIASVALIFSTITGTSGCVATSAESFCEEASHHVAQCLGTELPAVSDVGSGENALICNLDEAQLLMDQSCEELRAKTLDQKSDFFDDFIARAGCRLGFYYLCETPMCDAELDEPVHMLDETVPEGASACLREAIAYEGCGACQYYTCREAEADCGPDGYLIRYALRYCERFRLVSEPRVSERSRRWLRQVRRCLITTLDEVEPSNDCDSIEAHGYASHPSCYVSTGFCDLPIRDWVGVLNTIDPGDLRLREVFVSGHACLTEWIGD